NALIWWTWAALPSLIDDRRRENERNDVRLRSARCGLVVLGTGNPRDSYTDQVEPNHRNGKHGLIPRIGGRCEDGSHDKTGENRVFDVAPEETRSYQAHLCQKEDHRRYLEHHAHADQHLAVKVERIFDFGHEHQGGRAERPKERDHVGKDDVVTEGRATDSADRG